MQNEANLVFDGITSMDISYYDTLSGRRRVNYKGEIESGVCRGDAYQVKVLKDQSKNQYAIVWGKSASSVDFFTVEHFYGMFDEIKYNYICALKHYLLK